MNQDDQPRNEPQPVSEPINTGMSSNEVSTSMPQKKSKAKLWITISIVVVVVLIAACAAAGYYLYQSVADDSKSVSEETKAKDEVKPFVSSEFKFSATFPGTPTITHTSEESEGVKIPVVRFMKELDNGAKAYMIQVADYPTESFTLVGQERGALDGAVSGSVDADSTLVSSSNDGTFLGYPSADSVVEGGGESEGLTIYSKHFIVGNQMYSIILAGVSESDYTKFVESFKFNEE